MMVTESKPKAIDSAVSQACQKLESYVEREGYKGYDPYDTLNSRINFRKFGKWGPAIAIQIQKRNPVNLRGLLGIEKGYNPKAMGLFLHAYSLRYKMNQDVEDLKKAKWFFNWLKENPTKGYSGYCWGYNFDWANPGKYLEAYSPTIVVSGFIAKGIFAYYDATADDEAVELLKGIGEFILKDLFLSKDDSGICFSYNTVKPDCCYNASMLGAELFAKLFHITREQKYRDLAIKATNFVVSKQQEDGHWKYAIDLDTGNERHQVDFHQGYVLDSIEDVIRYAEIDNASYISAQEKGIEFFYHKQFTTEGRALYRYPDPWPVEIHNQSQGIITLSRMKHYDSKYLDFASVIADYTIKNMQDKSAGFFYYKKYPLFTIKTPFIRWAQAWMFLALTELMYHQQGSE